MGQMYWGIAYVRVFLAYCFLMYVWPCVVFFPFLRGRSLAYRFLFCAASAVLSANMLVLLLGLIGILRAPVAAAAYLGIFLWRLLTIRRLSFAWIGQVRRFARGVIKPQRVLIAARKEARARLAALCRRVDTAFRGRWIEVLSLAVLLLFGTVYFSWNAMQMHTYGFSDQYVHHAWIYGLEQGKIFSAGIYPEGMHCCLYLACTLFRIRAYHVILFWGGASVHTLLLAMYLFMKELFRCRTVPLLVLALYLTVDERTVYQATGMSRLTSTLPMEMGFFAMFACTFALLRFLRDPPSTPPADGAPRPLLRRLRAWSAVCLRDDELRLFCLSVAVTLCTHFYATLIAIPLCLPVAAVHLDRTLRPRIFAALAAASIAALLIVAAPMAVAYGKGIPLQGSLYWAMSYGRQDSSQAEDTAEEETDEGETGEEETAKEGTAEEDAAAEGEGGTTPAGPEALPEDAGPIASAAYRALEALRQRTGAPPILSTFLVRNYMACFTGERGGLLFCMTIGLSLLLCCIALVSFLAGAILKKHGSQGTFRPMRLDGYLIILLTLPLLLVLYDPTSLHLPSVLEKARGCSTNKLYALMLFGIASDLVLSLLRPLLRDRGLQLLTVCLLAGIYVSTRAAGIFHGYQYYQVTRYAAAAELTERIIDGWEPWQYTVVSTTDELYELAGTGYHEELIDLIDKQKQPSYTIPTPYVFLFIEKRPIYYSQYTIASGPDWLANDSSLAIYSTLARQYPDLQHGEISPEKALEPIHYEKKRSDTAAILGSRVILESKAWAWYQEFIRLYPYAGTVVYEDDDFLCYCFTQDHDSLYTLSILPKEIYAPAKKDAES